MLVPIGQLANGATILQEDAAEITYWRAELDSHDLLIANRLPAESHVDVFRLVHAAWACSWFLQRSGDKRAAPAVNLASAVGSHRRPDRLRENTFEDGEGACS